MSLVFQRKTYVSPNDQMTDTENFTFHWLIYSRNVI